MLYFAKCLFTVFCVSTVQRHPRQSESYETYLRLANCPGSLSHLVLSCTPKSSSSPRVQLPSVFHQCGASPVNGKLAINSKHFCPYILVFALITVSELIFTNETCANHFCSVWLLQMQECCSKAGGRALYPNTGHGYFFFFMIVITLTYIKKMLQN